MKMLEAQSQRVGSPGMEVEFRDKDCNGLETDPSFNAGQSRAIVEAYRKRLQAIRAAPDERTFYAMKSLDFEEIVRQ